MSVRCWIRADRHDGNDPEEATITLAHRPVEGDLIEVWDGEGGHLQYSRHIPCPICQAPAGEECRMPKDSRQSSHGERLARSGESRWLEVDKIVHSAYGDPEDDTLEVWVKMDGYDLKELEATIAAAGRRDSP